MAPEPVSRIGRNTAAGSRRELRSVGLAVAGWLSRDRQDVRSAVNLGITATPLARLVQARLNCPVIVENDGNAAAYAEFTRGAGQQARVLMLITLGTGVGGGIVSSGTIVQGSHGLAGELGHIPVEPVRPRLHLRRPWLPRALRQRGGRDRAGPGAGRPARAEPPSWPWRPASPGRSPPGRSCRRPGAVTPARPGSWRPPGAPSGRR